MNIKKQEVKMKEKTIALLTLAIFLVAMLPSVMAEQGPDVTPGVITSQNQTPEPKLVSATETVKKTLREKLQNRTAVAEKLRSLVISKARITARKAVSSADVRSYLTEKYQAAVEKCEELGLEEGCKNVIQNRINKIKNLPPQALENLRKVEARKLEISEKIAQIREDKNLGHLELRDKVVKAREVARNKIEAAKNRFEAAVESYGNAKEALTNVRNNFVRARETIQECTGENTSECVQARMRIKLYAKNYTLRFLEMNLEQLEKLESKIEASEDLTDEQANELLDRIANKSAEIQDLMDRIESVTNETSKEEVQELIEEVKSIWNQDVKYVLERTAGFLQTNKMGGVYVRIKHLEKRLENTLAKLAERGLDTSAGESAIDAFNEKVEEARTYYDSAMDKYKEAATLRGEERASVIREAQGYMSDAKAALKEAQDALRDAVQTIKGIGATEEDLEEDEADEVLDVQEEEIATAEE